MTDALFRAVWSSPTRGWIRAAAASLCHSHSNATSAICTAAWGNAGSLTYWVRPEIEPTFSGILFGFLTLWATKELLCLCFFAFVFVFVFLSFSLFRAIPAAYGSSLARGWVGAATTGLWHICNLCCSSRQHWILNPLSEARDWTHVLMDARWVR